MQAKRKDRWSPEASYARGEETRERILQAALHIFGEHGFAAGSTRQIVARSGTNMAALRYYFGSKDGLYRACADLVVTSYAARIGSYPSPPGADESRASIIDRLCDHLDIHIDLLDGTSEAAMCSALFVAREQATATPGPVSDLIYSALIEPGVKACAMLVAHLLDRQADDPLVVARTFAMFGQVTFLRINLAGTLRLFGWDHIGEDQLALLRAAIRQQVQDVFSRPS